MITHNHIKNNDEKYRASEAEDPVHAQPLLSVKDLSVSFHTREGVSRAVNGLTYDVFPGETLGIVGESGSGKSVSQYALLGLLPMPPARIEVGTALFQGQEILHRSQKEYRSLRGREISMIFQDPMTALNPFMTVGKQLKEPLRIHEGLLGAEARHRVLDALHAVGIQDGVRRLDMYPHEFSGGMRQRVMIAMALITRPRLLIADEPTTALDVTVQAQILALIRKIQHELNMTVTLITHDLGVIAGACERVIVMYAGQIMETAPVEPLFTAPRHPYTSALLASLPSAHTRDKDLYTIPGMPPDPMDTTMGCPFAPRCAHATEQCQFVECSLKEVSPGHWSACVRTQAGEL